MAAAAPPSKDAFRATARALGARVPASAQGESAARRAMGRVLSRWTARLMDAAAAEGRRASKDDAVGVRAVRSALSSPARRAGPHRGGEGALGHTVLPLAYFGGPRGAGAFSAEGRYTQHGGEGALGHAVLPPAYFGRDEGGAYSQAFEDAGHTAFSASPCLVREALTASPGATPLLRGGGAAAVGDRRQALAYVRGLVQTTAAERGVRVTPKAAALMAQHLYASLAHGLSASQSKLLDASALGAWAKA